MECAWKISRMVLIARMWICLAKMCPALKSIIFPIRIQVWVYSVWVDVQPRTYVDLSVHLKQSQWVGFCASSPEASEEVLSTGASASSFRNFLCWGKPNRRGVLLPHPKYQETLDQHGGRLLTGSRNPWNSVTTRFASDQKTIKNHHFVTPYESPTSLTERGIFHGLLMDSNIITF